MKPKSKAFNLVWSYFMITLASAIYAVGFNWFYVPNDIAFGGITGVGQIINAILPWAPIGTVVIILNLHPGLAAAGRTPAAVLPVRHGGVLRVHRHHQQHLDL